MASEIIVPRLGWSMEEGVFREWLKAAGDLVRKGEAIFLLEGDKAVQEIEAFDSGRLYLPEDSPQPGDNVQVGQRIAYLLQEGEQPPATLISRREPSRREPSPGERLAEQPGAKSTSRVAGPAARRLARQLGIELGKVTTPDPTGRVITEDLRREKAFSRETAPVPTRVVASPRARRRARELGVNWRVLPGSGRCGRILERDVIAESAHAAGSAPSPLSSLAGRHEPATAIRRTIARRLQSVAQETVPVTLTARANASQLVALRRELQARTESIIPSYTDILMRLVALALPECPRLNACWDNNGVFLYDDINIALAVDMEEGLVTPVIRAVDKLNLAELANRTASLIERARSGKLTLDDLQGGTFTVTSLGMFGIDEFTPIINVGQSAILGVGRIVQEPVVRDGEIVIEDQITLNLTFDHRVIDGAPAARWLQSLMRLIAEPFRVSL